MVVRAEGDSLDELATIQLSLLVVAWWVHECRTSEGCCSQHTFCWRRDTTADSFVVHAIVAVMGYDRIGIPYSNAAS